VTLSCPTKVDPMYKQKYGLYFIYLFIIDEVSEALPTSSLSRCSMVAVRLPMQNSEESASAMASNDQVLF